MTQLEIAAAVAATPASLIIVVPGHRPAPQGSKKRVGNGQMKDDCARLEPWRDAVKTAAIKAWGCPYAEMRGQHEHLHGPKNPRTCCPPPLDGPLAVAVTFTCRQSQKDARRASRGEATWPTTTDSGDVDKLQRAAFDAITFSGCWADDARVVEVHAYKVHPGQGADSLAEPGAVIQIWKLTGES